MHLPGSGAKGLVMTLDIIPLELKIVNGYHSYLSFISIHEYMEVHNTSDCASASQGV